LGKLRGDNVQIVSVKQVSDFLKVKDKTIYQWAELGQIPCFKIHGALRFDMDEIIPWLQSFKKEPLSCYNGSHRMEAREGGKVAR
jgi:predicted DNA-binding transcriptional regulator AlpA